LRVRQDCCPSFPGSLCASAKKMSGFALESSRPWAVPGYVEAGYVRQRTEPHADLAYFRTATLGDCQSVQVGGFRQTIKRNSHEVFNSVFSGTDGAGVERVRQTDCRDSCGGGYSSRSGARSSRPGSRRPDRCHRIDRINRIAWGYRRNRIHGEYRRDRIRWEYRSNRIDGGYRDSRSARQNRWRHRDRRSGFASRALSSP
jgi:hypothetical protein